jgi:hypothetical protein
MLVLEAFAHQEGYFKPGSRPQRNNNPLDLEYGNEAIRFGSTGSDGRFAIFPNVLTGWNAARRWLSIPAHIVDGILEGGYVGATFEQVINRFAPPNENNTNAYIDYVCTNTGHLRTDILTLEMLVVPNVNGTSE